MNISPEKVFISYAREDHSEALNLYNSLKVNGIDAWLDTENLLPGSKWEYEIRKAIKEASFFIAIISRNSTNKKGYIQKELRMGFDILHEYPENQIYLIPVRLDDTLPISPILQELNWVDLFKDRNKGIYNIVKAINLKFRPDLAQSHTPKSSPVTLCNKEKVLLIDEYDQTQLLIKEILEKSNYQVHCELSGDEALKKFDEISPDIVLIEMHMSEMSGLDILKRILALRKRIPAILFSEHEDFRTQLATWAADEFLVKYSLKDTLLKAISRHLNKKT